MCCSNGPSGVYEDPPERVVTFFDPGLDDLHVEDTGEPLGIWMVGASATPRMGTWRSDKDASGCGVANLDDEPASGGLNCSGDFGEGIRAGTAAVFTSAPDS